MGARTGLLVYADGQVPELLRQVHGTADPERTLAVMRRLYPGWEPGEGAGAAAGTPLWEGVYPPKGTVCAGSWPGVDVICDRRVMIDQPSRLPKRLVAAGRGRRMILHAMYSVTDWTAFAVWEDGQLVRSLSLSPRSGTVEDIGAPLPFERPGHPLELGEAALRALCGFGLESRPEPDDVDADAVRLIGFTR